MSTHIRVFALVLSAAVAANLAYASDLRVVAYEGGAAPGVAGGIFSSPFGSPSLNAHGQVAFYATLAGHGSSQWSDGNGSLRMVADTGQDAPGLPGESFHRFLSSPALDGNGRTSFAAEYRTNYQAIWIERNAGLLELIAARGDVAIGADGNRFTYPFAPQVNKSGRYLFYSQLENGQSGLWTDVSRARTSLAVSGQQPAGVPSGAAYSIMGERALNDAGHATFSAYMEEGLGGVTEDNRMGIWSNRAGDVSLVYRAGSQAPGTPEGSKFRSFERLQMNQDGQVAFEGALRTGAGGVTSSNSSGIWSEGNGALELVARRGSQAPGTPVGAGFIGFYGLRLSDSGAVALMANLLTGSGGVTNSNNTGLWSNRSGELSLVAREGDAVPGLPGAEFGEFAASSTVFGLHSDGRIAFTAGLKQGVGGVTLGDNFGLWAENSYGALQLIARKGDQLEVAPGDVRTIEAITFPGQFSAGIDSDYLAFRATFTDGIEAIVVASLTALPGDFNGDSSVDGADFLVWQRGGSPGPLSGDDLADWKENFGSPASPFSNIPEPNSGFLCLCGAVMHFLKQRRVARPRRCTGV